MKVEDLTQGNILKQIIKLALPIIAGSFVQMAYNMTDIFWIGKLGAHSVTAVGVGGYIIWFTMSLGLLPKVGVEIGISQSIGRNDSGRIKEYAINAIKITTVLSIFLVSAIFSSFIDVVSLFDLGNDHVDALSWDYLKIISIGFIFFLLNIVFTGIYTGLGDSKLPFYINSIGLVMNMLLDPILINGWFFIKAYGVQGAAIASIFSQLLVSIVFIFYLRKRIKGLFSCSSLIRLSDFSSVKSIVKVGLPVASQSILFVIFAIIVARTVTMWGTDPLAVISIGANVEAVSWMTSYGFATALGAFIGQNYGAGNWSRIKRGFAYTFFISGSIGLVAGIIFYFFPTKVFGIFIDDINVIALGSSYLKIVAISQVFMCLEMTVTGVFNGLGNSLPPALAGIIFNGLRVLGVFYAAFVNFLDIVWWSISLSSVFKGLVVFVWMVFIIRNHDKLRITSFAKKTFARFLRNRLHQEFFDN